MMQNLDRGRVGVVDDDGGMLVQASKQLEYYSTCNFSPMLLLLFGLERYPPLSPWAQQLPFQSYGNCLSHSTPHPGKLTP